MHVGDTLGAAQVADDSLSLVILPLLPSCQSSLHFPLPVHLHFLILCALTHVF